MRKLTISSFLILLLGMQSVVNAKPDLSSQSEYENRKIVVLKSRINRQGWQAYQGKEKISPERLFTLAQFEYESDEFQHLEKEKKSRKTLSWILTGLGTGFIVYGLNKGFTEDENRKEIYVGGAAVAYGVYTLLHIPKEKFIVPIHVAKQAAEQYNNRLNKELHEK